MEKRYIESLAHELRPLVIASECFKDPTTTPELQSADYAGKIEAKGSQMLNKPGRYDNEFGAPGKIKYACIVQLYLVGFAKKLVCGRTLTVDVSLGLIDGS